MREDPEVVGQTPAAGQPVLNILVVIEDIVELLAFAVVLFEIGHWRTVLPLSVDAFGFAHSQVLIGGGRSDG